MPFLPIKSNDPLPYLAGRSLSPTSNQIELKRFYSKEELFARYNLDKDIVELVSKKYDIENWVKINQVVPIDITLWVGLDDWQKKYGLNKHIRDAITNEVNKIVETRNNSMREQQRKMEMEKAQATQLFQGQKVNLDKFFK